MSGYADRELVPEGLHRCRILSARKTVSKAGRDVIRMHVEIYGYYGDITHYITFMPERPEFASRQISELFDSFRGMAGELDTRRWSGYEGACVIEHDEYMGQPAARIAKFVPASEQDALPHFPSGRGVIVY